MPNIDPLFPYTTLFRSVDDPDREVVGEQRAEYRPDLAALEHERRGDGYRQLEPERDGASAEHADRPPPGDVFWRRLFVHHFGADGKIFVLEIFADAHFFRRVAGKFFRIVRALPTIFPI